MIRRIAGIAAGLAALAVLGFWLGYVPWHISRAERLPVTRTPQSLGVSFENVAFPARGGGLTIRGWWVPAHDARAIVVFIHGGNANREDALDFVKFFNGQRMSVLAPDLRNHGLSDATPTRRLTMGYDESKDAIGAIDYAQKRAPGLPVYLMGVSMGGATAIYASAADPRVKKLILFDPVLDAHETSLNAIHAMLGWPHWLVAPALWSAETFFPGDPGHHNPLPVAERLKLPILLVKDDNDLVCLPVYARELAARNQNVTLWMVRDPGLGSPVMAKSAGWGGHAAAYRFDPDGMKRRIARFLSPGN
jgi:pimeloyl-ACP methyl ester carboxylesterase